MSNRNRFRNDLDDQPTDSEEEMSEDERELLSKARNNEVEDSDSEEEVLGVHSDSDSSDIALSDVEGQDDDDGLPDAKAWGKNKRNYYSTDYVDPDYGGFEGKDAALAELEEEEARNLQRELAKQLDDDDFSLGVLAKAKGKEKVEEVVKTDVSLLSRRQKLDLLQKESPEFFGLVEDFEGKMRIVRDELRPVIVLHRRKKVEDSPAMDFVKIYYELILNYSSNIYMYLLLKANRANVQTHPVVKRLYQFRQLFEQMDPIFKEVIQPQLELLTTTQNEKQEPIDKAVKPKKKTLKLLSKLTQLPEETDTKNKKKPEEEEDIDQPKKKKKKNEPDTVIDNSEEEKEDVEAENQDADNENEDGELGKRAITYQIAKNKGLKPHRKKEQRNPRVKHRNKFRKAKIRRKGAIREVRTEMKRYGGEMSGIKASVTKSIKIKS